MRWRFRGGKVLSPGHCVTGYWLITVPNRSIIRAIQFTPDGGPVLIEWPTLRSRRPLIG
jgi:hypothetical protein